MAVLADTVHEQSVPAADERADSVVHQKSVGGRRGKGFSRRGRRGSAPSPGAAGGTAPGAARARTLLRGAGDFALTAVRCLAAGPGHTLSGLRIGCLEATLLVRCLAAGTSDALACRLVRCLKAALPVRRFAACPGHAFPRRLIGRGEAATRGLPGPLRATRGPVRRVRKALVTGLVRCPAALAGDALLGRHIRRGHAPALVRTLFTTRHVQHRYRPLSRSLQRWSLSVSLLNIFSTIRPNGIYWKPRSVSISCFTRQSADTAVSPGVSSTILMNRSLQSYVCTS